MYHLYPQPKIFQKKSGTPEKTLPVKASVSDWKHLEHQEKKESDNKDSRLLSSSRH